MRLLPPLFAPQSAFSIAFDPQTNQIADNEAISSNINSVDTLYPTFSEPKLSKEQTAALADELDSLYKSVVESLGANDAQYIERVYKTVVYSEVLARGMLVVAGRMSSWQKTLATWLVGTSLLSFSKILNNMELGHNVMHGQYDWMQHPHLNSKKFDWDIVCPAPLWQHSHNYLHHTFTNIVGRDHDVGYHLLRVTDEQIWTPSDRHNLLKTMVLALGFEWAVAFHDIQISADEYADSPELATIMTPKSQALFAKITRQIVKDYMALPAVAALAFGRASAMTTLTGNITANITRNLWTWAVIFCGHFTEQAHIYTRLDENETKGDWYVRQILGSSNIEGNKYFHLLTGNLSHQIEHHIFPDMPANHYQRIAPQVQAICHKYGLFYNTGKFGGQFKQMLNRIHHFSKPTKEDLRLYLQQQNSIKSDNAPKEESPSVISEALKYFSIKDMLNNTLNIRACTHSEIEIK